MERCYNCDLACTAMADICKSCEYFHDESEVNLMDIWTLNWECDNDCSTQWAYSSKKRAKNALTQKIGEYILDCVNNGNSADAVKFIENMSVDESSDEIYVQTDIDYIYINKLTIDKDV